MKNIIVALDNMSVKEAFDLTDRIKEYIWGVKLNDLIDREGVDIITDFKMKGINVFADPNLKDIPNTVRNRIRHYEGAGADFVTVIADGGREMMMAAKESVKNCKVIGVTLLTSLSIKECNHIYNDVPIQIVERFVNDAIYSGLDGVVCSSHELDCLDRPLDVNRSDYLIAITPGIRPEWYYTEDDQKRTSRPKTAIRNGADYLVIGRPITQAINPSLAARLTYEEVNSIDYLC